jgi:hypothetical protein
LGNFTFCLFGVIFSNALDAVVVNPPIFMLVQLHLQLGAG